MPSRWQSILPIFSAFVIGILFSYAGSYWLSSSFGAPRKQYWSTSLERKVDDSLLRGLNQAVTRGDVAWLDIDPKSPIPMIAPGTNLILYHVGGDCYIGSDCDRFPSSEATHDQWGDTERMIDLTDPAARKIVIDDLVAIVRQADQRAPASSVIGIHLDNVHRLDAQSLADLFNQFLQAVNAARNAGLISSSRKIGYVAKNNPQAFKQALDRGLLNAVPLYQINENATLSQDGTLDEQSRVAQEIRRQYCVPVFLKTFGTDVAYTNDRDGAKENVYVSADMTSQMAEMPNISGAAWSINEARYHPTIFVQGSPVPQKIPAIRVLSGRNELARSRLVHGRHPGRATSERTSGTRP